MTGPWLIFFLEDNMKTFWHGATLLAMAVAMTMGGCAKEKIAAPPPPAKDYYRELPPGASALRKITDPALMPDFRPAWADREGLQKALDESIRYLAAPSSRKYYPVPYEITNVRVNTKSGPLDGQTIIGEITHQRVSAGLALFAELLKSSATPDELQQRIVAAFDVYESVGCDDRGTVQFTGYYTPIFDASLVPTAEYKYPLYKRPADLVSDGEGKTAVRRKADGTDAPYYTRAEIDAGALKGNELAYLKDRFEAYICTIQGSARLRLPDGSWFNVGYAGFNGKDYTSIGKLMIKDGAIAPEQLSLSGLMSYFASNPDMLDVYLPLNERYVFFKESDTDPQGSLGRPVTPYRSLATDKSIFPRGALTFVETNIPVAGPGPQAPFKQFMFDQDAGGAIRAAGRADIYLGIGDEAGRIAGWTLSEGKLYYLIARE
jgi:membrane-bound lytic murein transglycosylase A